jgi:endonuclease-3
MFPELRGMRLKTIAERIQTEFEGDLAAALRVSPIAKARAALKKFSNIADPGADRILLFAGISPVAAVRRTVRRFWPASGLGSSARTTAGHIKKRSRSSMLNRLRTSIPASVRFYC